MSQMHTGTVLCGPGNSVMHVPRPEGRIWSAAKQSTSCARTLL